MAKQPTRGDAISHLMKKKVEKRQYGAPSNPSAVRTPYLVELLEQETLARARRPSEENRLPLQHEVDHVPLLLAQPLWNIRGRGPCAIHAEAG